MLGTNWFYCIILNRCLPLNNIYIIYIYIAGIVMVNSCSVSEIKIPVLLLSLFGQLFFFFLPTSFWYIVSRYNKFFNIVALGKDVGYWLRYREHNLSNLKDIFCFLMNGFRFHLVSHSYWEVQDSAGSETARLGLVLFIGPKPHIKALYQRILQWVAFENYSL